MSKHFWLSLTSILLLMQFSLHAQNKKMYSTNENLSVALRGKIFGFFIIENCYFSTGTIGMELMHKSGHSIGVDITFFHWRYEHDDIDDNPLTETYEKRTYALLDYKYKFVEFSECDLYFNAYDKIGTYRYWAQGVAEGYNDITMPYLADTKKGTFNQIGAGIGIKRFYSERSYIDLSMNGGQVFTNINELTYDESSKTSTYQFHVKNNKPIFYIRLNFGIILKGDFAKKPVLRNEL